MMTYRAVSTLSLRLLIVWTMIWLSLSGQAPGMAEEVTRLRVPGESANVGDTLLAYSRSALTVPIVQVRAIKKVEKAVGAGLTALPLADASVGRQTRFGAGSRAAPSSICLSAHPSRGPPARSLPA